MFPAAGPDKTQSKLSPQPTHILSEGWSWGGRLTRCHQKGSLDHHDFRENDCEGERRRDDRELPQLISSPQTWIATCCAFEWGFIGFNMTALLLKSPQRNDFSGGRASILSGT